MSGQENERGNGEIPENAKGCRHVNTRAGPGYGGLFLIPFPGVISGVYDLSSITGCRWDVGS